MLLLLDFMMNSLIIAIAVMVHYWALYKLARFQNRSATS